MNTPVEFRVPRRGKAGAALILALAMLVLLSGLVLAYMLTVRTEFKAAKAYEGGTDARLLADSAMNRVLGQLREATTQDPTQPIVTWISQPGLIRTFKADGIADKSYKLYSADSLIEKGSFDPTLGTDLPGSNPESSADPNAANFWKKQPSLWTDLNQPAADRARKNPFDATQPMMVYPIFDGNHLKTARDLTKGAAGTSLQLSLNNDGFADIEGFKVTDKYSDGGASMPVKWLYMLKDGTLVPAKASGTGGDVELVVPADKRKTAQGDFNGVVARVAFWTDDESAKVNLNTAAEGTYWDTPVGSGTPAVVDVEANYKNPTVATQPGTPPNALPPNPKTPAANAVTSILTTNPYDPNVFTPEDATFEWEYMYKMPAKQEYQRYTGHPAMTCLSTIFGRQLRLRVDPASGTNLTRTQMCEEIFKMIPRVSGAEYDFSTDPANPTLARDNSSKAGMVRAWAGEVSWKPPLDPTLPTTPRLTPDGERLYASVDEFLYNPNFKTSATSNGQRTVWKLAEPDPSGARDKTREMLEMSHFFLSANSKSPEQNLFNLPRVSIWPIHLDATKRTSFDKVFAFCSTAGDKSNTSNQFYFTREDCWSQSQDLSPRNLELMKYLQALTSSKVPGWNTTGAMATDFASKYGTDHTQILTEIFDYIRCTNLCDVSEPVAGKYPYSYTASGWGVNQLWMGSTAASTRGAVVPIVIPGMGRGIGRYITISEMAMIASRKPDNTPAVASIGWTPQQYEKNDAGANILYTVMPTAPAVPSLPSVCIAAGSPFLGQPVPLIQGNSRDALVQIVLNPELYCVMAGYSVAGFNMRISFTDIDCSVDFLKADDTPTGQPTARPFDNVTQPSMYHNGAPVGMSFDYTYGSASGIHMLLPHSYTAGAPAAGTPNRFSAPPSALVVVKNAQSLPNLRRPTPFPSLITEKLKISLKFNVVITGPVQMNPTNTTGEPVIQKFAFDFGAPFIVPVPEPIWPVISGTNPTILFPVTDPNYRVPYINFTGNTPGSNQAGNRYALSQTRLSPGPGNYYGVIYKNYLPWRGGSGVDEGTWHDVLRTLVPKGNNIQADYRLLAAKSDIDSTYFLPSPSNTVRDAWITEINPANGYTFTRPITHRGYVDSNNLFLDRWRGGGGAETVALGFANGSLVPGINTRLDVPTGINGVTSFLSTPGQPIYGDWDSGPFMLMDGALCNKADEGATPTRNTSISATTNNSGYFPNLTAYMGHNYNTGWSQQMQDNPGMEAGGLFSPNRQIASAVMFGSLPTGVNRGRSWQTLLFRPAKYYWPGGINTTPFTPSTGTPYATIEHPGSAKYGPPDHLLLDLFWMPVVEPYPISEPFATAGKVNLNQQIVPFTNIKRDTALRSVFKAVKIAALNASQLSSNNTAYISDYKVSGIPAQSGGPMGQAAGAATAARAPGIVSRRSIDLDNTLKQVADRLDNNKPFVSASEICDIPLIPKDVPLVTVPGMLGMRQHVSAQFTPSTPLVTQADRIAWDAKLATFWSLHKLTGDNLLERPYAAIYPRLTTRSNTYTVHVRVQTLKQNDAKKSYVLKYSESQPTGEFRGSFLVERYLDPNTAGIYDKADVTFSNKLPSGSPVIPGTHVLGPYRFRIVSSKQFQPE